MPLYPLSFNYIANSAHWHSKINSKLVARDFNLDFGPSKHVGTTARVGASKRDWHLKRSRTCYALKEAYACGGRRVGSIQGVGRCEFGLTSRERLSRVAGRKTEDFRTVNTWIDLVLPSAKYLASPSHCDTQRCSFGRGDKISGNSPVGTDVGVAPREASGRCEIIVITLVTVFSRALGIRDATGPPQGRSLY
jgi:hypothetical protein